MGSNPIWGSMQLLDHGYINVVDTWGSDERIIEAARMSTAKGFLGWGTPDAPKDEKLLKYLWSHKHHTPFEMAGLTLEVQAPIFVFREWMRHRTFSYNELSARYTALPDLFYIPSTERLMAGKQSTKNKQSSESGFTEEQANIFRKHLEYTYNQARMTYNELLASGLSRELARLVIPVSQYSRMRVSGNLRNWLAFIALRSSADAQWEIRQYSTALENIIYQHFPRVYEVSLSY